MGAAASISADNPAGGQDHGMNCSKCRLAIVGTRWKEKNREFNLCEECYTLRDTNTDTAHYVPIFVVKLDLGQPSLASSKLTPRNVGAADDCPLQNRRTYSSIINALPMEVVERERKNKAELFTNCPEPLQRDYHKFLGLFPAYAFPHEMDELLLELTEGCEWKVYQQSKQIVKYFLDMNNDLMGTLNTLMLERSYVNLARFRILIGFSVPLLEIPPWVKLFAAKWGAQLKEEAAEHRANATRTAEELTRRQFFSSRTVPMNFRMKKVPGGMKGSVLPGFISVRFTEYAKEKGAEFYTTCSLDADQQWFSSAMISNGKFSAKLEYGSPLLGLSELEFRFDTNFPNVKKFVEVVRPLLTSRGCDIQTAVNFDVLATLKLSKEYTDALMDAGMHRIKQVSQAIRLKKNPIKDSSTLAQRGKERWDLTGGKEGTLNLTDVLVYSIELEDFSQSQRVSEILKAKMFKKHLHLQTVVQMTSATCNNVTLTFGVRLREVAKYYPYFVKNSFLLDQIGPDHFTFVRVMLVEMEAIVLDKYILQLKELEEKDDIDTESPIRDMATHLDEIGSMKMENRKSFFSTNHNKKARKEKKSLLSMLSTSFNMLADGESNSQKKLESVKE